MICDDKGVLGLLGLLFLLWGRVFLAGRFLVGLFVGFIVSEFAILY